MVQWPPFIQQVRLLLLVLLEKTGRQEVREAALLSRLLAPVESEVLLVPVAQVERHMAED